MGKWTSLTADFRGTVCRNPELWLDNAIGFNEVMLDRLPDNVVLDLWQRNWEEGNPLIPKNPLAEPLNGDCGIFVRMDMDGEIHPYFHWDDKDENGRYIEMEKPIVLWDEERESLKAEMVQSMIAMNCMITAEKSLTEKISEAWNELEGSREIAKSWRDFEEKESPVMDDMERQEREKAMKDFDFKEKLDYYEDFENDYGSEAQVASGKTTWNVCLEMNDDDCRELFKRSSLAGEYDYDAPDVGYLNIYAEWSNKDDIRVSLFIVFENGTESSVGTVALTEREKRNLLAEIKEMAEEKDMDLSVIGLKYDFQLKKEEGITLLSDKECFRAELSLDEADKEPYFKRTDLYSHGFHSEEFENIHVYVCWQDEEKMYLTLSADWKEDSDTEEMFICLTDKEKMRFVDELKVLAREIGWNPEQGDAGFWQSRKSVEIDFNDLVWDDPVEDLNGKISAYVGDSFSEEEYREMWSRTNFGDSLFYFSDSVLLLPDAWQDKDGNCGILLIATGLAGGEIQRAEVPLSKKEKTCLAQKMKEMREMREEYLSELENSELEKI